MIVKELRQPGVILICTDKDCRKDGCKQLQCDIRACIRNAGLKGSVRIQKTKCLGPCGKGPNAMVYPGATLFTRIGADDVAAIVEAAAVGAR